MLASSLSQTLNKHAPKILVDPYLDANTDITPHSLLRSSHNPRNHLWVPHQRTSNALLHRPALRTPTIQIHPIDPRTDHLCRPRKLLWIRRSELCDQGMAATVEGCRRAFEWMCCKVRVAGDGRADELVSEHHWSICDIDRELAGEEAKGQFTIAVGCGVEFWLSFKGILVCDDTYRTIGAETVLFVSLSLYLRWRAEYHKVVSSLPSLRRRARGHYQWEKKSQSSGRHILARRLLTAALCSVH